MTQLLATQSTCPRPAWASELPASDTKPSVERVIGPQVLEVLPATLSVFRTAVTASEAPRKTCEKGPEPAAHSRNGTKYKYL